METAGTTCKNCGNQFSGKYCNVCGEKVYTAHDKSLSHFFEDAFHFITHFEGTFFNTLKAIFTRPGKLSYDYCNGLRKKYFRPLSFFMLLVILYLIFPYFTGLNMPFKYYVLKGSYAARLASKKTAINIDSLHRKADTAVLNKNFSNKDDASRYRLQYSDSLFKANPRLDALQTTFNKKSEKTSKLLLLILLPLTAMVLWILAPGRKKYFFDHLVLSTEINSFFVLFTFLILPLLAMLLYKLSPAAKENIFTELNLAILSFSFLGIYCFLAFRRFYNDKWWWALIKAALMIVANYFIVQMIYKFVLFLITFYLSV